MEKKIEFIKSFMFNNGYGFVPITDDNSINIIYNVLNGIDVRTIYVKTDCAKDQLSLVCLYIGCYFEIIKKYKESYDWYFKSANGGNVHGQLHLHRLYYIGNEIVKQNLEESKKWCQKALNNKDINDDEAQCVLAVIYYYGNGGFLKDCTKAIEILTRLVERGHAWSLYSLGYIYKYDKKNMDEAIKYYIMAFEAGITCFGIMHELSDTYIIKKDYVNAMKWLEIAHKKEYPEAKEKIKLLLQTGDAAIQLIDAKNTSINKLQEENNKLKQENAELAIMPSDTFKAYTEYMEKANTRKRRRHSF